MRRGKFFSQRRLVRRLFLAKKAPTTMPNVMDTAPPAKEIALLGEATVEDAQENAEEEVSLSRPR